MKGLGKVWRDAGQSREPAPPESTTDSKRIFFLESGRAIILPGCPSLPDRAVRIGSAPFNTEATDKPQIPSNVHQANAADHAWVRGPSHSKSGSGQRPVE